MYKHTCTDKHKGAYDYHNCQDHGLFLSREEVYWPLTDHHNLYHTSTVQSRTVCKWYGMHTNTHAIPPPPLLQMYIVTYYALEPNGMIIKAFKTCGNMILQFQTVHSLPLGQSQSNSALDCACHTTHTTHTTHTSYTSTVVHLQAVNVCFVTVERSNV